MKRCFIYLIALFFCTQSLSQTPIRCQYWFNEDYSQMHSVDLSGEVLQTVFDVSALDVGFHRVYFHLQKNNEWASPVSFLFFKANYVIDSVEIGQLRYKCWFDKDTSTVQSGNFITNAITLNAQELEEGVHFLYMAIERNGIVTSLSSYMFIKIDNELPNSSYPENLTFSYWYDTDDANKMTGVLQNGVVMLDAEMLSEGNHFVNIMVNNTTPTFLTRKQFYKAAPQFVLSTDSDSLQGRVEGIGIYDSLSVVEITAVANQCYNFVSWNDGNSENPRNIALVSDTNITAIFEEIISTTELSATICEGEIYSENGFNENQAGIYTQILSTINGCDSIITLSLNVNPSYEIPLSATICEGEVYAENNFNESEAGVYTQTLQTINGCDSIITLNLNVNPVFNTEISATICQGSVYAENGFEVNETGVYTQNLLSHNGCDSIVSLTLNINPIYDTTISAMICQGSIYTENGFNESEAGIYVQNLQSVSGCDSIVRLSLSVNPLFSVEIFDTICFGQIYSENGFSESEEGVYSQMLSSEFGCDSLVTLSLSVKPSFETELSATICEGYNVNISGINVSEAGVYTQILTAINGCDSVITLTVNTNPVFDTTIYATINQGNTYSEHGFNENEAGVYLQTLTNEFGCDSTITLILNIDVSLSEAEIEDISFYPNPTNAKISFSSTIESIEVIDLTGRCILTFSNAKTINIELLPAGAYYLRLTNNDKAVMRKVIKE